MSFLLVFLVDILCQYRQSFGAVTDLALEPSGKLFVGEDADVISNDDIGCSGVRFTVQ